MKQATGSQGAFQAGQFRHVLGHYPTGVAVITAEVAGEAVEMVVGSFTSVSLDPPLVAFLPSHSSASYGRMRGAKSFVVNILSASDAALARQMASKDAAARWLGVDYSLSGQGLRKLDAALAHIECDLQSVVAAGDHDIVLARVSALDLRKTEAPLIFCQGQFGTFSTQAEPRSE